MRALLVSAFFGSLLLAGCAPPASVDAPVSGAIAHPTRTTSGTASPVRLIDDVRYTGEVSAELSPLEQEVNNLVLAHPSDFAGTYFSADRSVINIAVARPGFPPAEAMESLLERRDPDGTLAELVPVKFSWVELNSVKKDIVEGYLMPQAEGVQWVGLDTSRNTVVVGMIRETDDAALTENPAAIEIAERFGESVMFRESAGEVVAATSS